MNKKLGDVTELTDNLINNTIITGNPHQIRSPLSEQ